MYWKQSANQLLDLKQPQLQKSCVIFAVKWLKPLGFGFVCFGLGFFSL